MRLLIVTFDPPQNIGGVEGRVRGYVTELTRGGEFVVVEALAPGFKLSREVFEGSILYNFPSDIKGIPPSFSSTLGLITGFSIDSVFLLSGGITIFGNLLLLYSRISRKRTAILLYGKDILQARQTVLGRALLFGSLLLTKRIATNSKFTASLLPAYVRRKTASLFPSVDPRSISETHEGMEHENQTVLFVGRLIKRKGVDDLLEAFKTVLVDLPDARLEIVGDGPELNRLVEQVKRLGLVDKVTFCGSLRGGPLYERYRDCAVVAMPSKTMPDDVEGFGTVFLEAGLAGKPSVGTFSGGIPEAVLNGETGLLVKEGDVHALASALARLLGDANLRRQLGENARSRVLSQFTWKSTTQQLVRILSENKGRRDS